MVFTGTFLLVVCIVFLILWMSSVSLVVWRMKHHYNQLTKGTSHHTLTEVLEQILRSQHMTTDQISRINEKIQVVETQAIRHIQRIGIVRFNPFADTGGSQSFSFALLDGDDTGIVITSLYARTGNRWYLKEVVQGQGKHVELSKEESSAIRQARMIQS